MKGKILKEKDIVDSEEKVDESKDKELDRLFDKEDEVPAVGVSTFLKKEEPEVPKEEPKSDLELISEDIDKLRVSLSGGMNLHRVWVKLGEIQDSIKKLL